MKRIVVSVVSANLLLNSRRTAVLAAAHCCCSLLLLLLPPPLPPAVIRNHPMNTLIREYYWKTESTAERPRVREGGGHGYPCLGAPVWRLFYVGSLCGGSPILGGFCAPAWVPAGGKVSDGGLLCATGLEARQCSCCCSFCGCRRLGCNFQVPAEPAAGLEGKLALLMFDVLRPCFPACLP